MNLHFSAEGQTWPIKLTGNAERTRSAMLRSLPQALQLHTPKIAGSHIYWHAPFVEDVEGATHVLDAPAVHSSTGPFGSSWRSPSPRFRRKPRR